MARCTGRRLRGCLLAALLLTVVPAAAQDEPEYRLELGAGVGTIAYQGDFNGSLVKGMQPWGTLVARYHLNPRMALALNIGTGKIKGSSENADTWYPIEKYEFNHQLTEADIRYEYNFWAYGTGQEYRGARRVVPFIALGLGLTHYGGEHSGITMNLPLGAGVKWKAAKRLNVVFEWAIRFTMSDNLDGRKDVYGIESNGLFKNTDCYSILQLGVTYDLWAKCKTCNNDRD